MRRRRVQRAPSRSTLTTIWLTAPGPFSSRISHQDEAIEEAERTLALNPSFLQAYFAFWAASWTAGRSEKANEYADIMLRLSPRDPYRYVFLKDKGIVLFLLSRYEDAATAFEGSIASNPEYAISYLLRAASLTLAGQRERSREALGRYVALGRSAKSIAQVRARQPYDSPFITAYYDRVYQGLRKAGMPER